MGSKFTKTVKGMKRGKNLSSRLHRYFAWILLLSVVMIFGSAYAYWKIETAGQGSFSEALWTVVFTLIGQGEFARSPSSIVGKVIVFLLSVVGISLLGVVLSEVVARVMKHNMRGMLGLNQCKFKGHTILCGWNGRAEIVLKELLSAGQKVAVIASQKPAALAKYDAFFIAGEATNETTLRQAGVENAESAIVFAENSEGLSPNDIDSRSVLTALALETLCPEIYSVIELLNPENECHAQRAHVDDIIFCDRILANVVASCASQRGISAFIGDILSHSDDGSALCAQPVEDEWNGRTVGELFAALRSEGMLPVGIMTLGSSSSTEEWIHQINPAPETVLTMPVRAIFIVANSR